MNVSRESVCNISNAPFNQVTLHIQHCEQLATSVDLSANYNHTLISVACLCFIVL